MLQVFAVYWNTFCSLNFRVAFTLLLITGLLVLIPLTSALLPETPGYAMAIAWVTLMGR